MRAHLLILALLAAPATAAADEKMEIGVFTGAHFFNDDNELGQDDFAGAGSLQSGLAFGIRVARRIVDTLSAEGELAIVPTNMRIENVDVVQFGWRVHGLFHPIRMERFEPFALFGVGGSTAASSDTTRFGNDTDLVVHMGVGARFAVGEHWGLRLDARLALPPSSANESVTADGEVLFAIYRTFGPPPPPAPAQPPPSDPADPRDGVEPVTEKPPDPPPMPADGDGDTITDVDDKCPKEPETANGFDDTDGCPDQIPPEVMKYTGVISGIQFVADSAELAAGSAAVLDGAAAVMVRFPSLRIEIGGHTDSGGEAERNRTLSQTRAEAIRAYLVSKGVGESRLEAKGYGSDFPIANNATAAGQAQNRRVEFKLLSP
jgi:OOP family OmpA-OmpF porin